MCVTLKVTSPVPLLDCVSGTGLLWGSTEAKAMHCSLRSCKPWPQSIVGLCWGKVISHPAHLCLPHQHDNFSRVNFINPHQSVVNQVQKRSKRSRKLSFENNPIPRLFRIKPTILPSLKSVHLKLGRQITHLDSSVFWKVLLAFTIQLKSARTLVKLQDTNKNTNTTTCGALYIQRGYTTKRMIKYLLPSATSAPIFWVSSVAGDRMRYESGSVDMGDMGEHSQWLKPHAKQWVGLQESVF